jgi:hypothetical protein
MAKVREVLARESSGIRIDDTGPALGRVLRRAARRAAFRKLATICLALLVAVAGFAWIVALVPGDEARQPATEQATPGDDGTWPGIWPHVTKHEAELEQRSLEEGDESLEWLADGGLVAGRFAETQLGWSDASFILRPLEEHIPVTFDDPARLTDPGEAGPHRIGMSECPITQRDRECRAAVITVQRLVNVGEWGVWDVIDYETFTLPPLPTATPAEVHNFLERFLNRRLEGHGAEQLLTADGRQAFDPSSGGLALYGDYSDYEILRILPEAPNHFSAVVTMSTRSGTASKEILYVSLRAQDGSEALFVSGGNPPLP